MITSGFYSVLTHERASTQIKSHTQRRFDRICRELNDIVKMADAEEQSGALRDLMKKGVRRPYFFIDRNAMIYQLRDGKHPAFIVSTCDAACTFVFDEIIRLEWENPTHRQWTSYFKKFKNACLLIKEMRPTRRFPTDLKEIMVETTLAEETVIELNKTFSINLYSKFIATRAFSRSSYLPNIIRLGLAGYLLQMVKNKNEIYKQSVLTLHVLKNIYLPTLNAHLPVSSLTDTIYWDPQLNHKKFEPMKAYIGKPERATSKCYEQITALFNDEKNAMITF